MPIGDSFGRMLLDHLEGVPGVHEIVERDDGLIGATLIDYFASVRRWGAAERRGLRWVHGRVLDVGCGAGRVALELQRRGREVVGIDVSAGAVEAARRRGVRDVRLLAFEDVDASLGSFDTVVMYGNNFGLFASAARARTLLRRLRPVAGRIVASTRDPYRTDDPVHLAYQERNRARGRMPGQVRIRSRYRDLTTPWFDYLLASPEEVRALAEASGWLVRRVIDEDGALYVVVLEPASASPG